MGNTVSGAPALRYDGEDDSKDRSDDPDKQREDWLKFKSEMEAKGISVSGEPRFPSREQAKKDRAFRRSLDAGFGRIVQSYVALMALGDKASDDEWQNLVDKTFRYIWIAYNDDPDISRWCLEETDSDGSKLARCGLDIVWNVLFEAVRTRGFAPNARRMTPHMSTGKNQPMRDVPVTAQHLAKFPAWVRDREGLLLPGDVDELIKPPNPRNEIRDPNRYGSKPPRYHDEEKLDMRALPGPGNRWYSHNPYDSGRNPRDVWYDSGRNQPDKKGVWRRKPLGKGWEPEYATRGDTRY